MNSIFQIKMYGPGLQAGIGKVTKKIFDFWKDNEHVLEATDPNEVFDYAAIGVASKDLKLKEFWGYADIVKFDGLLFDSFHIEVVDDKGEPVLSITSDELANAGAPRDFEDYAEELDEFYVDSDIGKGYYLSWSREGDNLWFTGEIETNGIEFDIEQLRFQTVDFEGDAYIVRVLYEDLSLTNIDSSIRWNDPEIKFIKGETSRRNATGWNYELY